jgi:nucleoside-diphosphate-sugar epimerase
MNDTAVRIVRDDCERVVASYPGRWEGLEDSAILITGGTGFMGSWLAEFFCYLNDAQKTKIRLYLLARDKGKFLSGLPHIASRCDVEFIRCDTRNVVDIPKDTNYVIHAAATPDSRFHASNPIETMTTIAEGTGAILKAADRVSNLKMFVNVSSSAVYGAAFPAPDKIRESYTGAPECAAVTSAYGESKRYAETLCSAARTEARLPVVTIRPFTFIGPYQKIDAPWAINNFIADALERKAIRILGDGMTVRGVMYGSDMALWIAVIMFMAKSGQVYNLGNDHGLSLHAIAQRIASEVRPSPEILLNASLTGPIASSVLVPDTSTAQRDFGLRILTDIDTAVVRSIRWYRMLRRGEEY